MTVTDEKNQQTPTDDKGQDSPTGADDGKGASDEPYDLSKVNFDELSDKEKAVIRGFQKDYTQKTQKLSEEKKALKEKIEKADYYEQWHSDNTQGLKEYNDYVEKVRAGQIKADTKSSREHSEIDTDTSYDADDVMGSKDVKKVIAEQAKTKKELEDLYQSGFNMLVDLFSVSGKDDYREVKVEPRKVIAYALQNKITNMDKAVQGCYDKELREVWFSTRLKEEKDKWDEQQKAGTVMSGTMPGRTVRKVLARNR
jgi:hypothetical protein